MQPLKFDNAFVRELAGDIDSGPGTRQVLGALYSRIDPTAVTRPRTIAVSKEVAQLLDWTEQDVQVAEFAQVFAGNLVLPGMQPYAANYGGHQFGSWAGQLGDGRAISLGEVKNRRGERWELQLKGAGPTPYSRRADGRAVLRSSIREFLCSEAMFHLGVPTTRALCLVATGEDVVRDMFYDGNSAPEPGAIVCRVAPSFIRFGNFELPASRNDVALLKQLVDFTIERDFPELMEQGLTRDALLTEWFAQVCLRTARMISHWMRVGFVHGVMNTDNMSILGLTIDYGPYGWIDNFDLDWTPNTTDAQHRRYRFGQQPQVAFWNLNRLASALAMVFSAPESLKEGLERYVHEFNRCHREHIAGKLGLSECSDQDLQELPVLHELLQNAEVDMTIFFRRLANLDVESPDLSLFTDAFYDPEKERAAKPAFQKWLDTYAARVRNDSLAPAERIAKMNRSNPKYVLRNYLAQQAIDKAHAGDESEISHLLEILRRPYDEQPEKESEYFSKRPDWARHKAGCSMLSCSS